VWLKTRSRKLVIEPGTTEKNYWQDLWRYRELFYILTWRDIKVRYKQTTLGVLWSLIRPFLAMIIFTVVFSTLANFTEDAHAAPYAIMVFAALLPWQFFANALVETTGSLVNNSNLISKVYFPRLIIPTSSVITSLIDFAISFLVLCLLFVYYLFMPSWHIIFLPLFLLLAFVCSIGIGLWLTSLNVKYRDFRYILPFIVQFGLYISPVGFSSERIPDKWRTIYSLNPMVGVIDGFRWCILGPENYKFYWQSLMLSIVVSFLLFWFGLHQFRKLEKSFADII
jgi:lipopolysaccharide transport system permease protein